MALLLFAASTGATASPPNPSYTHLQTNNAPIPVMKSRITSHLRSVPIDNQTIKGESTAPEDATHNALHHPSKTRRDIATNALQTKGGVIGTKRRGSTVERARKREKELHFGEQLARRRSMAKRRQRRRMVQQQQRRQQPKIVPRAA